MFVHAKGNLEEAKYIIIGVPLSLGSDIKDKKYELGPRGIREGSYKVYLPMFGKIDFKKIYDYGDINIKNNYLKEDLDIIYKEIKKIYDKSKKYIFLGGNHLITYPILKIIKEEWDDFYLLYFDSHPDIHPDPEVNYESFLFYSIKEEIIEPEKILMIGVSNLSIDEKDIMDHWGIKYYNSFEIINKINDISKEISYILKGKNLYISLDLDVFKNMCGHWKEPFGIDWYYYFKIIMDLDANLLGFDITELYYNEFCNIFSARILLETISIFDRSIQS